MNGRILERAKEYYHKHIGYSNPWLWNQAHPEYRDCWIKIATIEIEDEERINNEQ